jgi:hypothetical protein
MFTSPSVFSVVFSVALFALSLTTPFYITAIMAVYGLWNPRLAPGTLIVLALLDIIFGIKQTRFFMYPGVLFIFGALLYGFFRFIRSRLASHVLQ